MAPEVEHIEPKRKIIAKNISDRPIVASTKKVAVLKVEKIKRSLDTPRNIREVVNAPLDGAGFFNFIKGLFF